MSLETFSNSSPAEIVIILIGGILLTMALYGSFPLLFAYNSKKSITKKKYKKLCYGVNAILMLICAVIDLDDNFTFPYIFWTSIFCEFGVKKLSARNLLEENAQIESNQPSIPANETIPPKKQEADIIPKVQVEPVYSSSASLYCRKCGTKLWEDSIYCDSCGVKVR